jgi:LacI family transcriptional regulator
MNKKITLKELAVISNFSVSTISKALSGNREISEETRKKIIAIAKLYNYRPNAAARSLKSQKTKTIGVIIPNILAHYFAKVLVGIEHEASKKGYNIITCISDESYKKEVKSMEMLASGSVDGFLISLSKETQTKGNYDHITSVINNGLPVLMFDRTSNKIHCDKVIINDFDAAYNATKVLLHSSCRKVIFISPISDTNVGLERANGYTQAITDFFNGTVAPLIYNFADYSQAREDIENIISKKKVDGIITSDELSAIFSMNIAISKGFKIPGDISIIGFTDGILSRNSNPPLTIVNQNETELGEISAANLIKRIENNSKESYTTQIIETNIIYRKSINATIEI